MRERESEGGRGREKRDKLNAFLCHKNEHLKQEMKIMS